MSARIAADRVMLPISRYLARHLILSSTMPIHPIGLPPAAGEPAPEDEPVSPGERVDVRAVRLALALLSRAARREVAFGDWLDARYPQIDYADRPLDVVGAPLASLQADLGRPSLAGVMTAQSRAIHIRAGLVGEPSLGEVPIVAPGAREDLAKPRRLVSEKAKTLQFKVDQVLAAAAHPHADNPENETDGPAGFGYDARVMAAFSCRYSPLAYLRLLAWTEAGAKLTRGWRARRVRGGLLSVEIPVPELQQSLGASGMPNPSAIEQQLIRPVAEDLRRVGVIFDWQWERGPRMKGPRALVLQVSDPRDARPPARTRIPTAMRLPRTPRPGPTGLRALRSSIQPGR